MRLSLLLALAFASTAFAQETKILSITQTVDVHLAPGANLYAPAYAAFTNFPSGTQPVRVTIEHAPSPLPVVPPQFWAFISVTNNETQMITTITPQP